MHPSTGRTRRVASPTRTSGAAAMFASRRRRWLVALVVVVVVGAVASAVVASSFDDGSSLTAAIDEAPLTRVADIAADDGGPTLGVYAQLHATRHLRVRAEPCAA